MKEFLLAPTILFILFVAPIWLIMHYRYKSKMIRGISEEEQSNVDDMLETIDKLTERVETLENILDKEHAQWRNKSYSNKEKAHDE